MREKSSISLKEKMHGLQSEMENEYILKKK